MNTFETSPEDSHDFAPLDKATVVVSPAELLSQFQLEGDQLDTLLEKLNRTFEEKLAELATKQLMLKLSHIPS